MSNNEIGYYEDPKNSNGIVRARTTKQLRSWQIPREIRALEKLNAEWGRIPFPAIYILFDDRRAYIGEASDIYDRLTTHIKNPEDKIKNWNTVLIINDGRPATQSDFNDNVVRLALEQYLIRLMKANRFTVVSQGRQPALNSVQSQIVNSLIQELNYFLLKKNLISKGLEEEGLQEIFQDELQKLLAANGKRVEKWSAYEAIVDRQKIFIRPGSRKPRGWQITSRGRKPGSFIDCLLKGEGFLLVARDGAPLVPLAEVKKVIEEKAFEQDTIDVWISFSPEKVILSYKDKTIDITEYKLRK